MSSGKISPSEGERWAISGYHAQYSIAASLIYRALKTGLLEWIRVADPDAGRVDDFLIGTNSTVDGYQVKWSQHPTFMTFSHLTSSQRRRPCIIKQLADGWERLREKYPESNTTVHLITNDSPSVRDHPLVSQPAPTPRHFSAFIQQAWNPAHKDNTWQIPPAWQPTWDVLQNASGLTSSEFREFVRSCKLEFGYQLPSAQNTNSAEQATYIRDIETLSHTLFTTVASPERIIQLNRDDLIQRVGWKGRLEFKSRHEFPDPDYFYEPIGTTVQQLQEVIATHDQGYLAVLGSPGSGKSTLLSKTLRTLPQRIIRYYAYVPDAHDPTVKRGELSNFLHDIILQIDRLGFRTGQVINPLDTDILLDHFYQQLALFHQDWQENQRKTIILIDGLDHIEREQQPQRSLLTGLPSSSQIPEGILIILGSQTDQLQSLPSTIQHSIQQQDRRIEMHPLDRAAVFKIINHSALSASLSDTQRESIYTLSDGHPLALVYILNRLSNIIDSQEVQGIIDGIDLFTGDIEAQYHSYWRDVYNDGEFVHFLGLVARLRGRIDLSWAVNLGTCNDIYRLRQDLAHYFRRTSENIWYFFHNSFRLFLINKTAESSPGIFSASEDCTYHRKLAENYAQAPQDSPQAWEEIYHRIKAEEHDKVLERTTQEWFRSQFLALRPIDAIEMDIRLALKSVLAKKDIAALTRLLLAGAEIANRDYHLEPDTLIPLLIELEEFPIAVQHMRDGNRLRIKQKLAMEMSIRLAQRGENEEGKHLFQLAEPLNQLRTTIEQRDLYTPELIRAWVRASAYYRDTDSIINDIQNIRIEAKPHQGIDDDTAGVRFQNNLFYMASLELIKLQHWDEFESILETLKNQDAGFDAWFWLNVRAWQERHSSQDRLRAQNFVEHVLKDSSIQEIDTEKALALAAAILRILDDKDEAKRYFNHVEPPDLVVARISSREELGPFLRRFRYYRLLYAFGSTQSPEEIVDTWKKPEHEGIVLFERGLCLLARIWAQAWLREKCNATTLIRDITPLLRLFYRPYEQTRQWTNWYELEQSRSSFFQLLIQSISLHDQDALVSLRDAFESEWKDPDHGEYWHGSLRRNIILSLYNSGIDRAWVVERLEEFEDIAYEQNDVSGRVINFKEQAEAWLEVNEFQKARRTVEKMLKASFGIGYRKDYQMDEWIKWLERINEKDPDSAGDRISWFAKAIAALSETTEGDAPRYASERLVQAAFRWSPRNAITILDWFTEQRIIDYKAAVQSILYEALTKDLNTVDLILHTLTDVLVPISTGFDSNLVYKLIESIKKHRDEQTAVAQANYMLSRIEVWALAGLRTAWRRAVTRGLDNNGIDPGLLSQSLQNMDEDNDSNENYRSLELLDGSKLSQDDIRDRVKSVSDLKDLLQEVPENSWYDWETIAAGLASTADSKEITELIALFKKNRRAPRLLSILSERLTSLNMSEMAWEIGIEALQASRSQEWLPEWGHGRISAFRTLINIKPDQGRRLALETFINDVTGEFWYPRNIVLNLMDILPLFTDNLPVEEIWSEIEQHVNFLFSEDNLINSGPDMTSSFHDDTPSKAISSLLVSLLDHPVNAIAQGSQRACAHLLQKDDGYLKDAINEALSLEDSSVHEPILVVLVAVQYDSSLLAPFEENLKSLTNSPDYSVSQMSFELCEVLGVIATSCTQQDTVLPAIYSLTLPQSSFGKIGGRTLPNAGEPLHDSTDPVELLRPFDVMAEVLADMSGFEKENICYRAVQIMESLLPREKWSYQGERELKSILDSADLRLTYRWRRSILARRALFHVIQELIKGDVLTSNNLEMLKPVIRCYDPGLILIQPTSRPSTIPQINVPQVTQMREKWLSEIKNENSIVSNKIDDDWIIIAEETKVKDLYWGSPEEIRRGALTIKDTTRQVDATMPPTFFGKCIGTSISDYPEIRVHDAQQKLIIRNTPFIVYDTPGMTWLALHPYVGKSMGWELSDDGLFRWVDNKGHTIVESIWWMDGLTDFGPPQHGEATAEGWMVLAKREALEQLVSNGNQLLISVQIGREYYDDDQYRTNNVRFYRDYNSDG